MNFLSHKSEGRRKKEEGRRKKEKRFNIMSGSIGINKGEKPG